MHPFIAYIENVKGDGHCGFRAISEHIGWSDDENAIQSLTFLPHDKGTREGSNIRVLAIALVHENHFVKVHLKDDSPLPPVTSMWNRLRTEEAATWEETFANRLILYKEMGIIHTKPPFQIQSYKRSRVKNYNAIQFTSERRTSTTRVQSFSRAKFNLFVGRNNHQLTFDDDSPKEPPFWLTPIKEALWTLKSLAAFLREQPSQLKYIEWPSFQSTLKTATLTLVLVALLIVALASVDAALCYLLTIILRRPM
ncbi:hypothetical protein LguiA_027685 [Lonicera macranthoides]